MPGPTPKNPKTRQRQNRHSTASTLVETSPLSEGAPELPKRRGPDGKFLSWRPEVVSWWNDVWASPMATEYVQADLHGLYQLADLMDQYWRKPSTSLAQEIRLQRQCFGLTPIDRRRLQWEVQRGEEAESKRKPKPHPRYQQSNKDPRGVLGVVK